MRIDSILQDREKKQYETAAWTVTNHVDGTFTVESARLGKHHFDAEQEKDQFIEDNYRGHPPEWGNVGIINIDVVRSEDE